MKEKKVHTFNILILTISLVRTLSQPLPLPYVEDMSVFTHDFIIDYDKFSDFGDTLIVDIDYPEYLQPLHKDLPFLPERKKVFSKQSKLACTFHNRRTCKCCIKLLQQALKLGLILKNIPRI